MITLTKKDLRYVYARLSRTERALDNFNKQYLNDFVYKVDLAQSDMCDLISFLDEKEFKVENKGD